MQPNYNWKAWKNEKILEDVIYTIWKYNLPSFLYRVSQKIVPTFENS